MEVWGHDQKDPLTLRREHDFEVMDSRAFDEPRVDKGFIQGFQGKVVPLKDFPKMALTRTNVVP